MRDETIERAKELLEAVGPLSHRKMFGGAGLYSDGVIFAILIGDEILLKADAELGAELEAAGGARWVYGGGRRDKPVAMPYWRLPEAAYDDPDDAAAWAMKALEVARRAPQKKPGAAKPRRKQAG